MSLQQYLPLAVLKPKEIYLLRHFGGVLQQYLPLAVLKPVVVGTVSKVWFSLQQYLPLAVLKRVTDTVNACHYSRQLQ